MMGVALMIQWSPSDLKTLQTCSTDWAPWTPCETSINQHWPMGLTSTDSVDSTRSTLPSFAQAMKGRWKQFSKTLRYHWSKLRMPSKQTNAETAGPPCFKKKISPLFCRVDVASGAEPSKFRIPRFAPLSSTPTKTFPQHHETSES